MTFYKVCRIETLSRAGFFSAIHNSYEVEYILNEWTQPRIGKLFVFNTLSSAKDFARHYYNVAIFECEVKNPKLARRIARLSIIRFWSETNNLIPADNLMFPLDGTYFADEVKITKEVW